MGRKLELIRLGLTRWWEYQELPDQICYIIITIIIIIMIIIFAIIIDFPVGYLIKEEVNSVVVEFE